MLGIDAAVRPAVGGAAEGAVERAAARGFDRQRLIGVLRQVTVVGQRERGKVVLRNELGQRVPDDRARRPEAAEIRDRLAAASRLERVGELHDRGLSLTADHEIDRKGGEHIMIEHRRVDPAEHDRHVGTERPDLLDHRDGGRPGHGRGADADQLRFLDDLPMAANRASSRCYQIEERCLVTALEQCRPQQIHSVRRAFAMGVHPDGNELALDEVHNRRRDQDDFHAAAPVLPSRARSAGTQLTKWAIIHDYRRRDEARLIRFGADPIRFRAISDNDLWNWPLERAKGFGPSTPTLASARVKIS